MGRVFTAYRNHPHHLKLFGKALNQETLGRWLGLTQAQVSRIEHSSRPETRLDILIDYAKVLQFPPDMLWFDMPNQSRFASDRQSGQESSAPIPPNGLVVPRSPDQLLVAHTGMDTLELLRRVRASAIDSSTVDALDITVQQLCCDYAYADPHELMKDGRNWLSQMIELLGHRLTLRQHRDILSRAGVLALLVGCVEYDTGQARTAEATRRMAMDLGKESGEPDVIGWSHEMSAWFHLTAGNYRAVIAAAEAGEHAAPTRPVAVQLYGQEAKAWARMGDNGKVIEALEKGRKLLNSLPYPERPDNHFVVDPDKWDFYEMDCYRIVGEDPAAKQNAQEVIRKSVGSDGVLTAPMRNTEAQLTLGVITAREGDVEEAAALGIRALRNGRQCRPSLLMVASELEQELKKYGPNAGADFRRVLNDIKTAS
jgi:hypothetical protein